MQKNELEALLLNHLCRPEYQPVKPRVIAKQLGLDDEQVPAVRRAIRRFVKRGEAAWGAKHVVHSLISGNPPETEDRSRLSAEEAAAKPQAADADSPLATRHSPLTKNRLIGIYRRTQSGYGFVRPQGTKKAVGRDADIYVPHGKGGDAADGDTVLIRLRREFRRGEERMTGEVMEVIERDTHQFVGSYFESAGMGLVQVDGKVFTQPILVGDPGAKGVQQGDKVVIEMVRFPSHVHDGEAVITEVLGKRGEPGVDTLLILREFNLPDEFSEEVLEAAREQAELFNEAIGDRLDLTEETIITIDPVDARDFDDAISLRRIDNNHWLLGVHIADVSHFVPPKSPLDDEARNRATSVYLPQRVIPMLPEIISNNLASLQPDRVRYTKTAFIEFTPEGARVGSEFHSSAIRSKRRFTYEEIDDYLEHRTRWQDKLSPEVYDLVGRMHELAMMLRRRRMERGSLELSLREIELEYDKDGRVNGAHRSENTESHQVIEEFMLAANEAVAEMFNDRGIFFLRRIHESPDPRKLKSLTQFVREVGIPCESLESRFEIQRVLNAVRGRPEEYALNFSVLRSLQKAVYSPQEEGHFALASQHYCHFTSPIRRYPDLTVHRILTALEGKKKPQSNMDELLVLGEHCSDREQRAEAAERELVKLKLLTYMSNRIGEELDAVITGVESFGLFVQGVEFPAEGLIHISSLADDFYFYDAASHSLMGRREGNAFRLGDIVRVQVARVDLDERELDFRLLRTLQKNLPPMPEGSKRRGRAVGQGKSPRNGQSADGKQAKGKRAKKSGKKGR